MVDGHRTAELRSIALHRLVAERLDEHLIAQARRRVEGWLAEDGPVGRPCAGRWLELLSRPADEIARALTADTEEMRDLRQDTPFAGAVSPRERWRVIREVG